MKLAWTSYEQGAIPKYTLYLILGESVDKYVVLDAGQMPENIAASIKSQATVLGLMPLPDKVKAIKELWPGYGVAYKEIGKSKLSLLREYPLG